MLNIDEVVAGHHYKAYVVQLDTAKGILLAALDHLTQATDVSEVFEGKNTAPEASSIVKIIHLAEHKLRKVMRNEPASEKEVQDRFEDLLVGADISYAREKVTFEFATKAYRPDFTIDSIELAVEIKLCKRPDREQEIIDEINADIVGYKTKYGNLFFVVYDVGKIQHVDKFAAAFEAHENVVVRVVKH
jgi:hypothetical protein